MKISVSSLILSAALAIGLTAPLSAHQETAGNLKIGHPWVRAAAEGASGTYGCIIEISNEGDKPERLLGATIDGAGNGVLYQLTETNGHFSSQPLQGGLLIKPHGSVELTPTTYQLRFGKVTKALTEDSMIDGTLVFETQGSVPIHFMVETDDTAPKEDAASSSDAQPDHDHMRKGM